MSGLLSISGICAIVAGVTLFASSAAAGGIIGKITAIDYDNQTVEISGFSYPFSRTAVAGAEAENRRAVELRNFGYGQVVVFTLHDGVVVEMTAMPGVTDIPQ